MDNNKIDNLDNYLENLSRKKRVSNVPDDSFVTYLGNKLKYEFSQKYSQKKKMHVYSSLLPTFTWRLAFASVVIILVVFMGTRYLSQTKTANQLASLDASITSMEKELAFLDKETQETTAGIDETIDQELESVTKL